MAFKKINVADIIKKEKNTVPEFKKAWDESRLEYEILGEITRLRKEKGLTQAELARLTGNKQQVISRIENRENSPTLKTICSILDVLNYDIKIVKKN